MAITEANRHQLYVKLEQLLGPEEATVLMEHLPPVGWADVATKRDLDVQTELLRYEVRTELHAEIGGLRIDVQRDLRELQRNLLFGMLAAFATQTGLVLALLLR